MDNIFTILEKLETSLSLYEKELDWLWKHCWIRGVLCLVLRLAEGETCQVGEWILTSPGCLLLFPAGLERLCVAEGKTALLFVHQCAKQLFRVFTLLKGEGAGEDFV